MNDGSLRWDALAFVLAETAVVLTVNLDTDEVVVDHKTPAGAEAWLPVPALGDVVGKSFGWCWVGANHLGYHDSFTLAFGSVAPQALEPCLTFLGQGSSLACFDLTPRRR